MMKQKIIDPGEAELKVHRVVHVHPQILPNKEAKPVPQNYSKMLKWTIQCLK